MRRDLVERAMAGDREAFTELARLSIDKLYAIARLILRDSERAQDATQEALVAAWRDLAGLRDPDRFEPWLRRLLVHACYNEARAGRRRFKYETSVRPLATSDPDPAVASADRDELERGLRQLTPEQRAPLVLHYDLGLSIEETALALGVPVGTAKSRLYRTVRELRASLEADARLSMAQGRPT